MIFQDSIFKVLKCAYFKVHGKVASHGKSFYTMMYRIVYWLVSSLCGISNAMNNLIYAVLKTV